MGVDRIPGALAGCHVTWEQFQFIGSLLKRLYVDELHDCTAPDVDSCPPVGRATLGWPSRSGADYTLGPWVGRPAYPIRWLLNSGGLIIVNSRLKAMFHCLLTVTMQSHYRAESLLFLSYT